MGMLTAKCPGQSHDRHLAFERVDRWLAKGYVRIKDQNVAMALLQACGSKQNETGGLWNQSSENIFPHFQVTYFGTNGMKKKAMINMHNA